MISQILAIVDLFIPTIWELINDRKGDFNKIQDIFVRYALAIVAAVINFFWITGKPVFDSLFLSMGIHFAIFDYAIAYILIKRGVIEPPRGVKYHWFEYLSTHNPFDNHWKFWNKWTRFSIRVVVLVAAIMIYIINQ